MTKISDSATIHDRETSFGTTEVKGTIKRLGINLGAPGDRKDAQGTLWLEYPSVGGKSPAVVTRNYPIADAATRITHGKSTNSGQICVSPDYALVPRERVDDFIAGVRRTFRRDDKEFSKP